MLRVIRNVTFSYINYPCILQYEQPMGKKFSVHFISSIVRGKKKVYLSAKKYSAYTGETNHQYELNCSLMTAYRDPEKITFNHHKRMMAKNNGDQESLWQVQLGLTVTLWGTIKLLGSGGSKGKF